MRARCLQLIAPESWMRTGDKLLTVWVLADAFAQARRCVCLDDPNDGVCMPCARAVYVDLVAREL